MQKQKCFLNAIWTPVPGKKVRVTFFYEEKNRPFFWIDVGKDGSIYLGESYRGNPKYAMIDSIKSENGKFRITYGKGRKITDPNLLKGSKVSFHSSGIVNAFATKKGWRSFVKPLRELNRRELLCVIVFKHPSQYKPIRTTIRKYDIILQYPFDERCPLACEVYVSPHQHSFPPVILKDAKMQFSATLLYQNLNNSSDLVIQMLFYHKTEGRWPQETYILWRTDTHQEMK